MIASRGPVVHSASRRGCDGCSAELAAGDRAEWTSPAKRADRGHALATRGGLQSDLLMRNSGTGTPPRSSVSRSSGAYPQAR